MSNNLEQDKIKMQGEHKIQIGTKISDGSQGYLSELNLLDGLQKPQTNRGAKVDQKQSNASKSSDGTSKQDNTTLETSTSKSTENIELAYDNDIFGDLFKKIKNYVEKSTEQDLDKNILISERQIFNDFFNLMEKHERNLTNENLSMVEKQITVFLKATDNIDSRDLFTADQVSDKKDIFYSFFNLFNLSIIQKFLKNGPIPDQLEIPYRFCITRILIVMRRVAIYLDLGLNDEQRPRNTLEIVSLMLNHVRTDFKTSDLSLDPDYTDPSVTRYYILLVIWEYAHKTVLVPDLIAAGCIEVIMDGLTIISQTDNVYPALQKHIFDITYNISRHDDGVKQLNARNAADLVKICRNKSQNSTVDINFCMILALLFTPEQIKEDSTEINAILDRLLQMMYTASVAESHRSSECHVSEPLIVLVKLFNNDRTLDYIMEHSKTDLGTSSNIDFFINLLVDYHDVVSIDDPLKETTCTAIVNILWSISFQERYKQNLKNASKEFKQLLEEMVHEPHEETSPNEYIPQYIEKEKKAAEGLLFNIDESVSPTAEQVQVASTKTENDSKPLIMISYSHGDIEFCQQLYEEILKKGYDIWIDFKFLKTGDLWEKIAAGMKQATIIVCLLSENYYESKSCRLEATYALDKLQTETRSVIPVFLRKHEIPEWLEIRTSVLKYVRFRDIKQIENDKLFELMDMIESCVPATVSGTKLGSDPSILSAHSKPAQTPTKKTNEATLQSNNISPAYNDQSVQKQTTGTKLENPNISSKSSATTNQSCHPEKPVEEWNQNDVFQWFEYSEILPELRDLCHFKDGYELLNYAKIFLNTENYQYQVYSEEFLRRDGITLGKKPLLLHEFTKFSSALRKLEKLGKMA